MTTSEADSANRLFSCSRLASLLRMRVNLKVCFAFVIIVAFFTTVSYWSRCNEVMGPRVSPYHDSQYQQRGFQTKFGLQGLQQKDDAYQEDGGIDGGSVGALVNGQLRNDLNTNTLEEIECLINGEYSVSCRRDGQEVYVPFSFLHKYFEVYGKVVSYDGGSYDRFEWQHSYSKFYYPLGPYDPSGPFMHFKNYNVEARDRVKCISAIDGVPISTQWDARGYHYPIQISQYGLSHYSKNLTDPEPRFTVYEDGDLQRGNWILIDGHSKTSYHWENSAATSVMNFEAPESLDQAGILIKLEKSSYYIMNFDFVFFNNGSFTITLEDRDHHEQYYIHYVCTKTLIMTDGNHVYYGLGPRSQWSHFTRDISIDFKKGFNNNKSSKRTKFHFSKIKILYLTLRGSGALDNFTTSSSSHLAHFFDATSWLLNTQDEHGGWPIPVERKFSSMGMSNLQPGWYSAMAQGQAMSLLTRAYRITKDKQFLKSALKAVNLFKIRSQDHGVMTMFLDKYVWYEEYPTIPSSFVLNGFIYALLGLYDLHMTCLEKRFTSIRNKNEITCTEMEAREVGRLYADGMLSLRKMLPLFDSGSTSIYDLRHFTLGIAPNLARWDYHTTHIDQLLLLATIDDDPILKTTAHRWIEYMKGKRAAHN